MASKPKKEISQFPKMSNNSIKPARGIILQTTLYVYSHTLVGLVLPAHGLQLLQRLFVGRLEFEELAGVLPALLLAALHLGHQLLALLLPVPELLLQDPLLLIQRLTAAAGLGQGTYAQRQQQRTSWHYSARTARLCLYLLQVHAELLHLSLQPLFGFLQRRTFGLGGFHSLLSLMKPGGQLLPVRHTSVGPLGHIQRVESDS